MPLHAASQKFVDEFFAAIAPFEAALRYVAFSYLAIKFGESYHLVRGRVFLGGAPPAVQHPHFRSVHVRAGSYTLKELGVDLRSFLNQLLAGELKTPDGPLLFRVTPGGLHGAAFTPFHPDGLTTQTRFNVLTLMATETGTIRQPDIDWEIKAASRPYDSLQELANDFSLGPLVQRPPYVEIIAYNVAVIDGQRSQLAADRADVHVLLAKGLAHDRVKLSYRTYARGAATIRAAIPGAAMEWSEDEPVDRGLAAIEVPLGAALNCMVSVDDIAQSHLWLSDPDRIQNPRRAVYEAFDPKLAALATIISNAQGRGEEARDLESAVAWLLWMLVV